MNANVKPLIARLLERTWVFVQDHEMEEANILATMGLVRRGWNAERQLTIKNNTARRTLVGMQELADLPKSNVVDVETVEAISETVIDMPPVMQIDGVITGRFTSFEVRGGFKTSPTIERRNFTVAQNVVKESVMDDINVWNEAFDRMHGLTIEAAMLADHGDDGVMIEQTNLALMAVMLTTDDDDMAYSAVQALSQCIFISELDHDQLLEFTRRTYQYIALVV